jgi:anti-sigma regulatory factor (Ser/Thr protein kinase)
MADDRSTHETVTLTIPAHAVYLRLARLAAADTGARAGLSVGDLEDLRIAVDELAFALIGTDTTRTPLTLRYSASDGVVEIDGACAVDGGSSELSDLARTIVGATTDEHELLDDGETRRFRLVKRTRA